MFDCDIILENRDENMIQEIKGKILEATNIINEIKNAKVKDREEIFRKYYPL